MLLFCTLPSNVLDPMVELIAWRECAKHACWRSACPREYSPQAVASGNQNLIVEGGNVSRDPVYLSLVKRPIGRLFFSLLKKWGTRNRDGYIDVRTRLIRRTWSEGLN
jgi:hypothetical protein